MLCSVRATFFTGSSLLSESAEDIRTLNNIQRGSEDCETSESKNFIRCFVGTYMLCIYFFPVFFSLSLYLPNQYYPTPLSPVIIHSTLPSDQRINAIFAASMSDMLFCPIDFASLSALATSYIPCVNAINCFPLDTSSALGIWSMHSRQRVDRTQDGVSQDGKCRHTHAHLTAKEQ